MTPLVAAADPCSWYILGSCSVRGFFGDRSMNDRSLLNGTTDGKGRLGVRQETITRQTQQGSSGALGKEQNSTRRPHRGPNEKTAPSLARYPHRSIRPWRKRQGDIQDLDDTPDAAAFLLVGAINNQVINHPRAATGVSAEWDVRLRCRRLSYALPDVLRAIYLPRQGECDIVGSTRSERYTILQLTTA
jgi:hypothetical protein